MVKRMALLMALALALPACSDRRDRDEPVQPDREPPTEQPSALPPRPDGTTTPAPTAPAPGPQSSLGSEDARPASDQDLTRSVRDAIHEDDSLSASAHNVAVSSLSGVVTLRGEVQDEREKSRIEQIAQKVAGVERVESKLEIAS